MARGSTIRGRVRSSPQCVSCHLAADAIGRQRLNSFDTRIAFDELVGRDLELGEYDQDGVDVVQARRRHLPNTPGPVKDLSGAQYHESLRLLGNDAEQQA